jgi:hypothetical protein
MTSSYAAESGHLDCLEYAHENGDRWFCPSNILCQNTLIYCIKKMLSITCDIKISNLIMWYLNQSPLFLLDSNGMETQRQRQEVVLKKKGLELSRILTKNLIPNLSFIIQRYIY